MWQAHLNLTHHVARLTSDPVGGIVDMRWALRQLNRKLEQVLQEEKWQIEESERLKVLQSSLDIIVFFRKTITRCSTYSRKQTLIGLYKLFKRYLIRYCDAIQAKIPAYVPTLRARVPWQAATQSLTPWLVGIDSKRTPSHCS
jgi:hypothetical protein